jgi:hypothetical protein
MALKPSNMTNQPTDVSDTSDMGPKWNDYKQDQLLRVRATIDSAAILKAQAKARIAARNKTVEKAGVPEGDNSQEASDARYHALSRMLDEVAFYPAHDQRKESKDYARVHHQMTVIDDKHCLVCGVQHSTLGDSAKNPFGAIALETHHHTIEWALANAIDADKFNQHILPGLKRQASERPAGLPAAYTEFDAAYANPMSLDQIKQWVDHAADNLWVLCDVHHRHKFVGIHAISYPIWGPQDVVEQGLVEQEIKQAKAKGTQPATGAGNAGNGG